VTGRAGPVAARLGHERGHEAVLGGYLLDAVLVHERIVGRLERVVVADVQLELARAGLRVAGLDRYAGQGQLTADLPDQVLVQAAAVHAVGVGARPERLQPPAGLRQRGQVTTEQVELVLNPDLRLQTVRAGAVDQPPQRDPGIDRHALAIGEPKLAEHPRCPLMPGQEPGGGQIRYGEDIREALLLAREVERVRVAAGRLDQFLALVGVLGVRDHQDHVAERDAALQQVQEGRHRESFAAPDPVGVPGPGDHGVNAFGVTPAGEIVPVSRDRVGAHVPARTKPSYPRSTTCSHSLRYVPQPPV